MVRAVTFLFLLLLSATTDSLAFHLNRGGSLGIRPQRPNNRNDDGGALKYIGSAEFDLRDGPALFTGYSNPIDRDDPDPSARRLSDRRYSASDWLHNLKTWRHSTVLREVRNPVIALGSWAAFVSLVQRAMIVSGKAQWASKMSLPDVAHKFLVSSIGLLLVFRTNSAYQRFLEGRKIWEEILSISRNLSRFVSLYRDEVGHDRRERILHLLAAFPYLLRHRVRDGRMGTDRPEEEEGHRSVDRRKFPWPLLEKAERFREGGGGILPKISRAANRPLWVCDRMGQEIMEIPTGGNGFSSRERLKLLGDVDKLADAIGSCERIHRTAVPMHYARHALRALTAWLATLPFSLVEDFGLLTGPVTVMVAWVLFGVYQIGHSIEDPFQGSLRLKALCDDIRVDILSARDDDGSAFATTTRNDADDGDDHLGISEFDVPEPLVIHPVLKPMMTPLDAGSVIPSEPLMRVYQYGS